jgi:hypothetical protein
MTMAHDTETCIYCQKVYSTETTYYMLHGNSGCHDCNMSSATEMVDFFMEVGQSKNQALNSIEASKGGGFRQVLEKHRKQLTHHS